MSAHHRPGYQPIENYGLVGDLSTVALVSMDASVDFMCFPQFDSPTLFAALLDRERGGYFQIAPAGGEFKHHQRYLPDTNILLTRFLGEGGVAAVSDFMPVQHHVHLHNLVRRVKVVRGELRFRMVCAPAFDYGRVKHTITGKGGVHVFNPQDGQPAVRLRSSVPAHIDNGAVVAEFKLGTGQIASFVIERAEEGGESPSANPDYVSSSFKETMNYWLAWVARSQYRGRWRETVNRSALTLKLLTSLEHGSIVAAPTFGLPETLGGERNWDYRYTWVRDASFTIDALMRLGYTGEAKAFISWIEQRCREFHRANPLQVMYHINGDTHLKETVLKHFSGYKNSKPVRIGNAAAKQLQLDIYGELLNAIFIYDSHGGLISYDFWINLTRLVEWVCEHWRAADDGIWEVRGGRRQFFYSKILCWVALDRAIRLAQRRSFPAPLLRWHRIRNQIYSHVYKHFWNLKLKCFVQYQGAKTVDAAALLMPMVKAISPSDPRWLSTMEAIDKILVDDSLVYRYRAQGSAPDGLSGDEGTFSMCSFWYAECVARTGDIKKARFLFEKTLGYANHLGLFAEQLGPCAEHLGNFPLALTHIALISAAWTIDQRLSQPNVPEMAHP